MNKDYSNQQCIVHGCTNKKHEGIFVGDICMPCYEIITTGKICPSRNFIVGMDMERKALKERVEELTSEIKKLNRIKDILK